MTRDEAVEVARENAAIHGPIMGIDGLEISEWVIRSILEADREGYDQAVAEFAQYVNYKESYERLRQNVMRLCPTELAMKIVQD